MLVGLMMVEISADEEGEKRQRVCYREKYHKKYWKIDLFLCKNMVC